MTVGIAKEKVAAPLPSYEEDETAWLEAMADLIANGRYDELDYANLREYLTDMANRDRREVESRLTVLMAHLLKWSWQPDHRSGSWRATILEQSQELEGQASSGVLRTPALDVLPRCYARAVALAVAETGLPAESFPADCPYTLGELLSGGLPDAP